MARMRCRQAEVGQGLQAPIFRRARARSQKMGDRERAQHRPVAAGDEGEPEDIDPAHLADVLERLAQAKRRQFATDAEVEAAFRRFDV